MIVVDRIKRVTRTAAVLAMSVTAGGCSLLPFGLGGGGGSSHKFEERAMRPEIHEVVPNAHPDCIALEGDELMMEAVSQDSVARGFQEAPQAETVEKTAEAPAAAGECLACGCGAAAATVNAVPAAKPEKTDDALAVTKSDAALADADPALARAMPIRYIQATDCGAGEDALQHLMDGNKRFVEGESENVYQLPQRPGDASRRRTPKAMVLACSDWSILPETAFDAAPGELYVVRVSGNVADAAVIESAKYALEQYDIPLIIVLGHEDCGALAGKRESHDEVKLAGATEGAGDDKNGDDVAAHSNIESVVHRLRGVDDALSSRISAGKLMVVGAFYDETNGQVEVEPESAPAQYVATPQD